MLTSYENTNIHHSVPFRDSILVPLINCGTSIYAGFAIFSVLGFMASEKGVNVEDVADEGKLCIFWFFFSFPLSLISLTFNNDVCVMAWWLPGKISIIVQFAFN